jgi:hypothetical protein
LVIDEKSKVTVGIMATAFGFLVAAVFWAATIQSDVAHIRDDLKTVVIDHEARIRILEKGK